MPTHDSLADHYSQLSDGEVLRLSSEKHLLTPQAVRALELEIERRRLALCDIDSAVREVESEIFPLRRKGGALRVFTFVLGHWLVGALTPTIAVSTFIYGVRLSAETLAPQAVWYTYEVLSLPFFPLQTATALAFGLVAAHEKKDFWRSRAAEFAWVIPCFILYLAISTYTDSSVLGETRWQHFFWTSVFLSRLEQQRTTLPFLSSVAYSVGHCLAKRKWEASRDQPA